MNTTYFLTGSFNDLDNDFELKITMEKKETATLPAVYKNRAYRRE
ncbi:hypothetical protein [Flavobacterium limi]|nr:hypothetical protein [Flavobacterium limi]